jgi:hypothetical protein
MRLFEKGGCLSVHDPGFFSKDIPSEAAIRPEHNVLQAGRRRCQRSNVLKHSLPWEDMMITVMRTLVIGCMLVFSLRQYLPDIVQQFDVLGLIGLVFVISMVWVAGTSTYRRIKEVRSRAHQHT